METKKQRILLNKTWDPKYIQLAYDHIADGRSMASFGGRYAIPYNIWRQWYQEVSELRTLNELYKTKLRNNKKFFRGAL